MPEIGATLREARMRQRIDISQIEAQTKIRAKYLRALENEEWDLLPGPTFVKSFLRTYAEALGLDARAIVEEYKLRHERLSEHELLPIAPPGRQERRRRGPPSGIGRDVLVALLVVGLVALLIVLGNNSSNGNKTPVATTTTTGGKATPARTKRKTSPRAAAGTVARLRLVPKGQVWVCLQAAGGRTLIKGRIIGPTDSLPVYRSKEFRMTFGNGNLSMRINGRTRTVPNVQNAVGYRVDRRGRRTVLSSAQRPTCA
jgi:transcriptional regulator with XRE-family HTH domain